MKIFDNFIEQTEKYKYLKELYYQSLKDNRILKDKLDDLIYEKNIIIEKYQDLVKEML